MPLFPRRKAPQAFRRVFTFCTIRPRQDSGTCTKAICKFLGKTVHFFAPIAGVFKNGYCLTTLHVPELAASAVTNLTSNPILIALLLITFIPDISLFIPKLCGYVPSVTPAWF